MSRTPGRRVSLSALATLVVLVGLAAPALAEHIVWLRLLLAENGGVFAADVVAAPDGAAYVVGDTDGTLPGQTGAGNFDAFVRKYGSGGAVSWTRQFGSPGADSADAAAADSSGRLYVVGSTQGDLPGQTLGGSVNAYLRKYRASGEESWTRQFRIGDADHTEAEGVALDPDSNAYVVGLAGGRGSGFRAFLRKYGPGGVVKWTRTFGRTGADFFANGVTLGPDGLYVVGDIRTTTSETPTVEAFARRYDLDGGLIWARRFDVAENTAASGVDVAADASVYVAGSTWETDSFGSDGFVRKFTASGDAVWTRRLGTRALDVAVHPDGTLVVVGEADGVPLVRKYGADGAGIWSRRIPLGAETATGAAAGPEGTTYVSAIDPEGAAFLAKIGAA